MGFLDELKQRALAFLNAPLSEMGRGAQFVRGQIVLWGYCFRRLRANNAMAMSAALSFRTIFAVVPMLIVGLLIFKAMGDQTHRKVLLERFLEESGLNQIQYATSRPAQGADNSAGGATTRRALADSAPATGPGEIDSAGSTDRPRDRHRGPVGLADVIRRIVDRAERELTLARLGPLGAVLLIWTALTLLTTVERSLNRVFEAPRPRSLARRTLIYWSVLTLGPLVLVTVSVVGERVTAAVQSVAVISWLVAGISWAMPVLLALLFLAAVYSLMPNVRVPFRAAVTGAVVAIPVWLVLRWGFSSYAVHVVTKQSYYGAIVLLPLALLWLNLSWWTFLFGAELAHSLSHVRETGMETLDDTAVLTQWHMLGGVLAVAMIQHDSDQPVTTGQIAHAVRLPIRTAEEMVNRLVAAGLVCQVADERVTAYVTLKSSGKVSVSDIFLAGQNNITGALCKGWQPEVAAIVEDIRARAAAGVNELHVDQLLVAPADPSEPSSA